MGHTPGTATLSQTTSIIMGWEGHSLPNSPSRGSNNPCWLCHLGCVPRYLLNTLSYTATWREKPRWSVRSCFWAMCRQTSRDVEAESTMTVRFCPVTRITWMGMCFLDLTA